MAAVIGALRANLGLDSAKFESGSKRSKNELRDLRNQFLAVAGVAVAFGGAIVTAALRGAAQIDELAKSARRLDGSVGGYRALMLAADEAGISLSSLTNDVQTMNRELSRAGEGGKVDDALERLGLTAAELLALDVDERLALIADRVEALGLSAGAATALLQDMGVRNREMALLVVQGGDAIRAARDDVQDYGLALSDIDAARIEAANDQMSRLGLASTYLGQRLALEVVPAFGALAQRFTDSLREGGTLRAVLDGLADNLGRLSTYGTTVVTLFGVRYVGALVLAKAATLTFATALGGLRTALIRTGIGAVVIGLGELVYRLGLAGGEAENLAGSQQHMADTAEAARMSGEALRGALDQVASGAAIAAEDVLTLARAHEENARAALASAQANLAARRVDFMAVTGFDENSGENFDQFMAGLRERAAAGRPSAQHALEGYEASLANIDALQEQLLEAAQKLAELGGPSTIGAGAGGSGIIESALGTPAEEIARVNEGLQALLDRIDPARVSMRGLEADTAALDAALREGLITQEAYNAALAALPGLYAPAAAGAGGAAAAIEEIGTAAEETVDATEGLASTFASTFAGIFAGTQTVLGGLAQLASQLGQMALMQGFKSLFGEVFSGSEGAGLASFFGFNANGTENWQGGLTMVGERGQELVDLPRGSKVYNAHQTAQMLNPAATAAPSVEVNPKIINLLDPSVLGDYLASRDGEKIVLNHMRRNGWQGA